jgi:hypothetical protein
MANQGGFDDPEVVDNYRLDHLYTNPFRDGKGKFFKVVSSDPDGTPDVVDAEEPKPTRNKVKTQLTFIKSQDGGYIKRIEFKRFKYYAKRGLVEQPEQISFSFDFFVGLIGFLQSLANLNLADINERRIPLHGSPDLDIDTRTQLTTLAQTDQGQELIRELVRNGHLSGSDLVNIAYRKEQLQVFEELISDKEAIARYREKYQIRVPGDEAAWQHFFEANTWIFGYGLNYIFNAPLDGKTLQQPIRGHDVGGAGKIVDGLLKSIGAISSICLAEIKTPNTHLMASGDYRIECWRASGELSGAIAQSHKEVQKAIENLPIEWRPFDVEGDPTGELVYTYKPRSVLVAGLLSEFIAPNGPNKEKFASFELLRKNTIAPEIITFDELLARAQFIVSNSN